MHRTWIALLLAVSIAAGQDVKDSYNKAKRKRGQAKQQFAAEWAEEHDGTVKGIGYLYLGLLWQYAENWDKAVDAFRGYLQGAKPTSKSRPRAVLEITNSQLRAKKYADAAATAKEFLQKFKNHAYRGRVFYAQGRARRAQGDMEGSLSAFRKGNAAKHKLCAYEVADCLLQLGRYEDVKIHAEETNTDAGRWKTLLTALPNMGKPLPKLDIDFWAGRDLGMGEIKAKPTLWSFWTTKVGNMRDVIHDITNDITRRFSGKVHVLGPALYVKFNPTNMKSVGDMSKNEERGYISGWKSEYNIQYNLCLLNDSALHALCGVDPAYPALPAFAISDNKGRLRYVRVGPEAATTEAIDAMFRRLLKE